MESNDFDNDRQPTPEEWKEIRKEMEHDRFYPPYPSKNESDLSDDEAYRRQSIEEILDEYPDQIKTKEIIDIEYTAPTAKEIFTGMRDAVQKHFDFNLSLDEVRFVHLEYDAEGHVVSFHLNITTPYNEWSNKMKGIFLIGTEVDVYCDFDWDTKKYEIFLGGKNYHQSPSFLIATFNPLNRVFE